MRVSWFLLMSLCLPSWAFAQADEAGRQDVPAGAETQADPHNHRPQLSSQQCGLSTDFNVLADDGGIWLYRKTGTPQEIFFHGGELSVDRKVQQVSPEDAQRLWEMERDARALMPRVAGIAHEVVDLTYDALGGVMEILTGSGRNARKVERMRKHANGYVDGTLGKGRWDQEAFDGNFEQYVEDQAEAFKGSIARHVLFQVFTGRADNMEARADAMGDALDAKLEARGDAIEAQADGLCAQVERLRALQDALAFRYQGQPLQMLRPLQDAPASTPDDAAAADAASLAAEADAGDAPRDGRIAVSPQSQH